MPKKQQAKVRKVKGWACILNDSKLNPCGNGRQWQYPIFFSRRDAIEFVEEGHGYNKIIPCTITYHVPTKKPKK